MSEEKKKSILELAEEKGLTKIKSEEDLINSYMELEKSFSSRKPTKESSTEEVIRKSDEFFKGSHDGKVSLSGRTGEFAQSLVDELKVHPKQAEAAVAKIAGGIAGDFKARNQDAVTRILANSDKKAAIERALTELDQVSDFQSSYNKGLVTAQEAELLARLGSNRSNKGSEEVEESETGMNSSKSVFSGTSYADLQGKWAERVKNLKSPFHNESHPEHHKVAKEVVELEKKLREIEEKS